MDDAHARIFAFASGQGGLNLRMVSDQVNFTQLFVRIQRAFDALNDNPAAVVATHDIHYDSHKWKIAEATPRRREMDKNQAPAVTVMTWRPL
jgi:hypothetical protein